MAPLVSCVLVTKDRPAFVRQALRYFSSQDYPAKELVVVDDGAESVEPLCRGVAGVTYLRPNTPTSTGTKLNLGIEAARGDILQKLDDDDFYAPGFLTTAVTRLRRARRRDALVTWCCFVVLITGERRLYFSGHGWKSGGTLCFRRELWRRRPFRDMYHSSDSWFIRDNQPFLARVCDAEQYLVVRHGANTWKEIGGWGAAENYFRSRPFTRSVRQIVGPRHAAFYRALMTPTPVPRLQSA